MKSEIKPSTDNIKYDESRTDSFNMQLENVLFSILELASLIAFFVSFMFFSIFTILLAVFFLGISFLHHTIDGE